MTRNKPEDSQYPLARRLAPAVLLAGGGVAFLAMVDGNQNAAELGTMGTLAPSLTTTTTSGAASQTTTPQSSGETTTTAGTGTACGASRSTGAQVQFRWGIVQVEAFLDGSGQLCEVNVLQYPNSDNRSVSINNYALPRLHDEALAAKSANIQAISGATLSSRAYMTSLQYALDHA